MHIKHRPTESSLKGRKKDKAVQRQNDEVDEVVEKEGDCALGETDDVESSEIVEREIDITDDDINQAEETINPNKSPLSTTLSDSEDEAENELDDVISNTSPEELSSPGSTSKARDPPHKKKSQRSVCHCRPQSQRKGLDPRRASQ